MIYAMRVANTPRSPSSLKQISSAIRCAFMRSALAGPVRESPPRFVDRKSTRLNSSHHIISYAVFCLKQKTHIALLRYADDKQHYIIAPKGLEAVQSVLSGLEAFIQVGNTLPVCFFF